jgi:hypothetical protein
MSRWSWRGEAVLVAGDGAGRSTLCSTDTDTDTSNQHRSSRSSRLQYCNVGQIVSLQANATHDLDDLL